MMPAISLNRFQTRSHYFHYLMLATAHQLGQRCPHILLVVRDQDAHEAFSQKLTLAPTTFFHKAQAAMKIFHSNRQTIGEVGRVLRWGFRERTFR